MGGSKGCVDAAHFSDYVYLNTPFFQIEDAGICYDLVGTACLVALESISITVEVINNSKLTSPDRNTQTTLSDKDLATLTKGIQMHTPIPISRSTRLQVRLPTKWVALTPVLAHIKVPRSECTQETKLAIIKSTKITFIDNDPTLLVDSKIKNDSNTGTITPILEIRKPINETKEYHLLFDKIAIPYYNAHLLSDMGVAPPRGVMLMGLPGLGKTHTVARLARDINATLITISPVDILSSTPGQSERNLEGYFNTKTNPNDINKLTLLFFDEIDALFPKRENTGDSRLVAKMLTLLDGFKKQDNSVVVIAATNRPNSIDPALRRPGRLDIEIKFTLPTENERLSLLTNLTIKLPFKGDSKYQVIGAIARLTHGYTQSDITLLVHESFQSRLNHISQNTANKINSNTGTKSPEIGLTEDDFISSMRVIVPTNARDEYREGLMKTEWSDVGGLESIKDYLKECLDWPMKHRSSFDKFHIKPTRGILLYGPPGCSKTTLARAIASGQDYAFFSLSGADVLSPYMGDAEKAISSIFDKARAAQPAVIFFDEIDVIAATRQTSDGVTDGGVGSRLLSTLLIEMDGCQSSSPNLLIVGATNRPSAMDPAIRRPGRFDICIYVGPPSHHDRKSIFMNKLKDIDMKVKEDMVDYSALADLSENFSGADIDAVVRESKIKFVIHHISQKPLSNKIINLNIQTVLEETIKSHISSLARLNLKDYMLPDE